MAREYRYQAVILYNGSDVEDAGALHEALIGKGIRCWFAFADLKLGDAILTEINKALSSSRTALICVGHNGLSDYQEDEWNTVHTAVVAKRIRGIPVYIGRDNPIDPSTVDDMFLRGRLAIDLRQGLENNPNLDKLISVLQEEPEEGAVGEPEAPPPPGAEEAPDAPDDPESVVKLTKSIADSLATKGLNILVGPTWPEPALPRTQDVALEMIDDILQLSQETRAAFAAAPIIPPEQIALPVTLMENDAADARDRIVRRFIIPKSLGEPEVFCKLATLVRTAAAKSANTRGPNALVITTNVDLAIERALLKEGVGFTRLVFDLSGSSFWQATYADPKTENGRLTLSHDSTEMTEELIEDLSPEQLDLLRGWYLADVPDSETETPNIQLTMRPDSTGLTGDLIGEMTSDQMATLRHWYLTDEPEEQTIEPGADRPEPGTLPPNKIVDFETYVRTVKRNHLITEYHNSFKSKITGGIDSLPVGRPVLVKLLGSYPINGSSLVSCDKHFEFAMQSDMLAKILQLALQQNTSIVTGYNLCEPVFRLLFEILLREPFGSAPHQRRWALLQAPEPVKNGSEQIHKSVYDKISRSYNGELKMALVADIAPKLFFERLQTAIDSREDNPW